MKQHKNIKDMEKLLLEMENFAHELNDYFNAGIGFKKIIDIVELQISRGVNVPHMDFFPRYENNKGIGGLIAKPKPEQTELYELFKSGDVNVIVNDSGAHLIVGGSLVMEGEELEIYHRMKKYASELDAYLKDGKSLSEIKKITYDRRGAGENIPSMEILSYNIKGIYELYAVPLIYQTKLHYWFSADIPGTRVNRKLILTNEGADLQVNYSSFIKK